MDYRRRLVLRNVFRHYSNIILMAIIRDLQAEAFKIKRLWTRQWLLRREENGNSTNLLKELETEDQREYKKFMRMSTNQFNDLLQKVTPAIQRKDTNMRQAISAKLKLQVTLSFLASGNSYRSLSNFFRVSKPAISKFIPEVLDAIYEQLSDFIKIPASHEEWKVIERGFNTRWNFPGLHGAIDGKHVLIQAPPNCGSDYFNYKGSNSIILMAVVDDDYCFLYINVGANGRCSDGGVFQNCSIFRELENNLLPNGGFFVGDDAFPLKTYLLKPYKHRPLTYAQKIFNYRLSRARRIVENAFGILVSRFRIFQKPIPTYVGVTDKIIRTSCVLHNWLRKISPSYLTRRCVDQEDLDTGGIIEGLWREDEINMLRSVGQISTNHSSRTARELRDRYATYFVNEGAVSWQSRMVH